MVKRTLHAAHEDIMTDDSDSASIIFPGAIGSSYNELFCSFSDIASLPWDTEEPYSVR